MILIKVFKSRNVPHAMKNNSKLYFFIRKDGKTDYCSIYELRELFTNSSGYMKQIEEFKDKRIEEFNDLNYMDIK